MYFLALTERQQDNIARAAQLLERLVALYPDNTDAQSLLGRCLDQLGNTKAAIEHWKQAVRTDPDQSPALYNLVRTLSAMHDPEARQYRDRLVELQKRQQLTDEVTQMRNFALVAGTAEDWGEAIAQMRSVIELCGTCPHSALLHKDLAYFYERTWKLDEAEEELHKAIASNPNDDAAQKGLAMLRSLRTGQRATK